MSDALLSILKDGQKGLITKINGVGEIKSRLAALGFRKGCMVGALYSAPMGGPRTYFVCGCQVSLRQNESDLIQISQ